MKRICIFGGGSLYRLPIYNLMSSKLGCDFYICEEDPSKGIKTYDYSKLKNFKGSLNSHKIVGNFYWLKDAVGLFWKNYDIYVVGGPFCISYWILLIFSFFSKKKVLSWSHGLYGRETGLRKLIKILYFKLCEHNFVYNERSLNLMVAAGVKQDKITVVGNSLDTDHDLKVRKSLSPDDIYLKHFKNDYPVLIFVGRVTQEKRLDLAIDAISIMAKRNFYVNFIVVGKDIDGVNLLDIADKRNVKDNVWLYGPCYDDAILGNLFYNADLCVSPGNVGLTAISSMTFGCPVISHDNYSYQGPEFESINSGLTGSFFKQLNAYDLADKIQMWLQSMTEQRRNETRKLCFAEIDSKWNIYSEVDAFKQTFSKF
jgi:glycosyltransferase involved in cell wall biosynthesis